MRCHYVPQFYLKNFSIHKEDGYIYAYRRNENVIKTTVNSVAAKNDLYVFTDIKTGKKSDELEKTFSRLEGICKPIIDKIIAGTPLIELTNSNRNAMAEFLSCMFVRNLSYREMQKNLFIEFSKLQLKLLASNEENFKKTLENIAKEKGETRDEKEIEEIRKSVLNFDENFKIGTGKNEDYFLRQSIESWMEISEYIFHKEWHVLDCSGSSRVFATSDNPVVILRPENLLPPHGVGIANGHIVMPISPKKCLLLINGNENPSIIKINRKAVDYINKHLMFFAHQFIYSNLLSRDIESGFNETKDGESERIIINSPI